MRKIDITCKGQKYIDINELSNFQGNLKELNKKEYKKLKNLILKYGFSFPVFVWKDHSEIIDGHQRILVVKDMIDKEEYQIDKIPVVEIEAKDKKEVAEKLLALNSKFGTMTEDGLYEFINENEVDFEEIYKDLELTDINVDKFLSGFLKDETKEDDVPDIDEEAEPVSKLGDIYELGEHRVMCGDSTSAEDVEKLMNGKKANMVFTDPPYNVDYGSSKNPRHKIRTIENDSLSADDWEKFNNKFFEILKKLVVGDIYLWGASEPEGMKQRLWLAEMGCHWSATIIWKKQQLVLSPANYQRIYEPCFYGWFNKSSYNKDRTQTEVWEDLRKVKTEFKDGYTIISFQGFKVKIKGKVTEGQVIHKNQKVDVWRYDRPFNSKLHPTMKPVVLVENAILNSSKRGGLVLDLFLGSGSTLIAAEKTGRACYGMELDPHYCDVIVQRWVDYTGVDEIKKNGKEIRWQLQ